MPILNYTTRIAAEKSAQEVQSVLAKHGVKRMMVEYENGKPAALAFECDAPWGKAQFILPARAEKVLIVMQRQARAGQLPGLSANKITLEQAQRVAWRIIKDN